jgi:hypothetical protein
MERETEEASLLDRVEPVGLAGRRDAAKRSGHSGRDPLELFSVSTRFFLWPDFLPVGRTPSGRARFGQRQGRDRSRPFPRVPQRYSAVPGGP